MKTFTGDFKIKIMETIEKGNFVDNLGEIYQDILDIKIDSKDSFQSMMNKFYDVMRKWKICQGTWSENGRTCNNAEWNMCFAVFKQHKILAFDIWLALSNPPEDLRAYGKEPKRTPEKA